MEMQLRELLDEYEASCTRMIHSWSGSMVPEQQASQIELQGFVFLLKGLSNIGQVVNLYRWFLLTVDPNARCGVIDPQLSWR